MTKLNRWRMCCGLIACSFAMAFAAQAQTFQSLAAFNGADGAVPWYMSPAQGLDGNLHGTTEFGGARLGCGTGGCGAVFTITPTGTLTHLRLTPSDGFNPVAGLMLATNGNFYGTALDGGANKGGAVFEVSRGGKLTLVYSFCGQPNCTDGEGPTGTLVEGTDGNYYGTTNSGGVNFCASQGHGCGTVFKITPEGALTTLYSFCSQQNCTDGAEPLAGLVEGSDGDFYGTTYGTGTDSNGGSVFRITPTGTLTTLHNFSGGDGFLPAGVLIQGIDGNFYGTTAAGGTRSGTVCPACGTVFKITAAGMLTTLYTFCSEPNCADGINPYAGLTQGTDGNLYGTTYGGGGPGTAYEITPGGTLTTLHSFDGGTDGFFSLGGLVQATNGTFYGTTSYGGDPSCDGDYGCGTVYSLDTGLGPFVAFVRPAGRSGQVAEILGQSLTGSSSVVLNGVPANFTVVSDTYIRATVPSGATTGYVTVNTPTGVLTSNVPFHVIP